MDDESVSQPLFGETNNRTGQVRAWVNGIELESGAEFVVDLAEGTVEFGSGLPAKPMIDRAFGAS